MKRIAVLGSGMVGSEIARDLSSHFDVCVFDQNEKNLATVSKSCKTKTADLSSKSNIQAAIKDFDFVVGALPGFMGYRALEAIIECEKDVVDISFFPEDPFGLDELAKKKGVCAVVDCGVAPGMSNFFAGYYHKQWAKIDNFECYVGGLPRQRVWPFEYKAPFSPIDVVEEYTRPARYLENGVMITRPALSDAELMNFDGVGTLEAFNTDGLRSLAQTINAPNMKEKTLRYPGHIRLIQAFKDAGFFGTDAIDVKGQKVRPIDLTNSLMFSQWRLRPEDDEFTVMRVSLSGTDKSSKKVSVQYDLFDETEKNHRTSSMARTTGYTCTAAVAMMAKGWRREGICPPEYLADSTENYNFMLNYLRERNVIYKRSEPK